MMHSKKLEDTALWKHYITKNTDEEDRISWIKNVYSAATEYLKDIRLKFKNYTLHDERHILNVMDAIGGLLGDQIDQLSLGELELLILASCMHDLGMVYTEEEEKSCLKDELNCKKFLQKYCPELLGSTAESWPEDICLWYLRTMHPFRIDEVLQNEEWKRIFDIYPKAMIPKRCLLAVCQSHGENVDIIKNNRNLVYLSVEESDPLFCALLLRLGDLLDFDDTRAPRVLYQNVVKNEKSKQEWDKHLSSIGFLYPKAPISNELPYKAVCSNPNIEHTIRNFLDWIDDELINCRELQKYCGKDWQKTFLFPRAVKRDEIESEGYKSGDFCLTMDQVKVLELLTGENLYENTDIFVRELLQNSIDAVLLRGKMDTSFVPEQSCINIYEWNDDDGNVWFRIDDDGTGMTLGILERYFLKIGSSYYSSKELEIDLSEYGNGEKYNAISRFGIGFLSCFLCGDYVEVSTLYYNPGKNKKEESYQTGHFGLRMQVTGLTGYYVLKSQAEGHQGDAPFPSSNFDENNAIDKNGYRTKPGTSIAVRLNPGKMGSIDILSTVKKYLCGSKVPVFYNNKKIGKTYEEIMQIAHELTGKKEFELNETLKKEFNASFPAMVGNYPKLCVTVIPLDTGDDYITPGLSGLIIKHEVIFEKDPQWKVNGQKYQIDASCQITKNDLEINLQSENIDYTTVLFWGKRPAMKSQV